jgi:single-strand DNA-binding protein
MALPTLTGVARLTADPELRFGASGVAVAKMNLAFNNRRKNPQTNEWEDSDVFYVNAVAFKQLAENICESFQRGTECVVTGRLKTEQWEDREGNKRSMPSLLIDSIGPSVAFATAKVQKMARSSGSGGGRAPAEDPWASQGSTYAQTAGADGRPFDDSPPF